MSLRYPPSPLTRTETALAITTLLRGDPDVSCARARDVVAEIAVRGEGASALLNLVVLAATLVGDDEAAYLMMLQALGLDGESLCANN